MKMKCLVFYLVVIIFKSCKSITFIKEPEDIVASYNSSVTFSCIATTPLVDGVILTTWSHNGSWITDYQNKHKLLQNGSLNIPTAQTSDQGTYQCSVLLFINNAKVKQKFSNIATLQMAFIGDSFLYSSSQLKVILGTTVHLQCVSPVSLPPCYISWKRNHVSLHGYQNGSHPLQKRTSSTLKIGNFSLIDVGNYQCFAINQMLSQQAVVKSKIISVVVQAEKSAPYFYIKPKMSVVSRYTTSMLHCIILGIPQPNILWFKDNVLLHENRKHSILNNGTLVFHQIKLNDTGKYFCQGVNDHGSITSHPPVPVYVTYIDFKFEKSPMSESIVAGGALILDCQPPHSYPNDVKITWYFDYKPITIDKNCINKLKNGSLLIKNISINNGGDYFCQAANRLSKVTRASKVAVVVVQGGPVILSKTRNITAVERESVQMDCSNYGNPEPLVYWTFHSNHGDNINITSIINNNALRITALKSNEGFYTCTVINNIGVVDITYYLKVVVHPKILLNENVITVNQSESTSIKCNMFADPEVVIMWLLSNTTVLKTTDHYNIQHSVVEEQGGFNYTSLLTLLNVTAEDMGLYTCYGFNNIGKVNQTFQVIVQVAPGEPVLKFTSSFVYNDTIVVECSASSIPPPTFILSHNDTSFNGSISNERNKRIVKKVFYNINETHSGNYSCCASNILGESCVSDIIVIKVPPHPPMIQYAKALTPYSITLLWKSTFNGNSPIILYTIIVNSSTTTVTLNLNETVTKYNIENLKPSTRHVVKMFTTNEVGMSVYTDAVVVVTLPSAPTAPKDLSLTNKTSTSVVLSWHPPKKQNGIIKLYEISYQHKSLRKLINLTTQLDETLDKQMKATVANLIPFTEYYFKVRAATKSGFLYNFGEYSNEISAVTNATKPWLKLSSMTVLNITTRSITIQYILPNNSMGINGLFKGYSIKYTAISAKHSIYFTTSRNRYVVMNLYPYIRYEVAVAICNQKGIGPYSKPTIVQTHQAVPGSVANISILQINSTSIQCSWNEPLQKNGVIIGYHIAVTSSNVTTRNYTSTTTEFIMNSLIINATYSVRITAQTVAGYGNFIIQNFTISAISPSVQPVSWLEQEYLAVIIGISIFSFVLLFVVIVLAVVRCTTCPSTDKEVSTDWKLNPYYGHNRSFEMDNITTKIGDITDSTLHGCDEDLIWDTADDTTDDNLVFSTHLEVPKYETPKPQCLPPLAPLKHHSYTTVTTPSKPPKNTIEPASHKYVTVETAAHSYNSVEPYQGQNVAKSPLIKLKGKNSKKLNNNRNDFETSKPTPYLPSYQSTPTLYKVEPSSLDDLHSLDNPPSFTNLNIIDDFKKYDSLSLTPSVDSLEYNGDNVMNCNDMEDAINDYSEMTDVYFERLGQFGNIDFNHVEM